MKYLCFFTLFICACQTNMESNYLKTEQATALNLVGEFGTIRSLSTSKTGVLVLDITNDNLGWLSPTFQVRKMAKKGEGPGEISLQTGHFPTPWIHDGNIHIVHSRGSRLDTWDPVGNLIDSFRWTGDGQLLFQSDSKSLAVKGQTLLWNTAFNTEEIPFGFENRVHIWTVTHDQFVCSFTKMAVEDNIYYWLFQTDAGLIYSGQIPWALPVDPADYPKLPEGMTFTPSAIYGSAATPEGFYLTERPFKPGPFQFIHHINFEGQVQTLKIKNEGVPQMDVIMPHGQKWMGYDRISNDFHIFELTR